MTAAAFNWSWVAQHTITSRLPKLTIRQPWRSLRLLFANRRWLFAFMVGIARLGALHRRASGSRRSRSSRRSRPGARAARRPRAAGGRHAAAAAGVVGVGLAIVGLVFLSVSLAGGSSSSSSGSWRGHRVVRALARRRRHLDRARRPLLAPGAGFGLAAGLLYAAADVGTKEAVHGGALLALRRCRSGAATCSRSP